jgi:hypothetical protein
VRRFRTWAWARVHWPLLAVAWGVSFAALAERFASTFGVWGGRACAFLADYAIWLGWEAVNRVSRGAGKAYAVVFTAAAVLVSFAFQVDWNDPATFVPPGLLAGGVIAAYILRPDREDVTSEADTAGADAGRSVSVGISVPAPAGLPGPAALPASGAADRSREDDHAPDPLRRVERVERHEPLDLRPVDHREPEPEPEPERSEGTRTRGRTVATATDRDAVYDMVRYGQVPEGPFAVKRAAAVEATAAADRATGGPGTGVTTRIAAVLLREARERVASGNGHGGQPADDMTEVTADA